MAEFWWQCPGCQKVFNSDHTSQPFCGSCMRYGRMRFAEQSEIADLRAQLAARDEEVRRLREAAMDAVTEYTGGFLPDRFKAAMSRLSAALKGEG